MPSSDDSTLARSVSSRLTWHAQVPPTVHARVEDGCVWLEGNADWRFQSDAAERVVRQIHGF